MLSAPADLQLTRLPRELLGKMTARFDLSARVVEIFQSESRPTAAAAFITSDPRSKRTGHRLPVQLTEITRRRDGRSVDQTPCSWDTRLINEHAMRSD